MNRTGVDYVATEISSSPPPPQGGQVDFSCVSIKITFFLVIVDVISSVNINLFANIKITWSIDEQFLSYER